MDGKEKEQLVKYLRSGTGSCYGKEKRIFEVLGERTKRRGVWLVISRDVKEMELLVGETPGGSLLCSWYWLNSKERRLRLERRYR